MNFEENRLRTFENWPANAPVKSNVLAKQGFFATGRFLEVECFVCHSRISSWVYGDNMELRHREIEPTCLFLRDKTASLNVEISENQTTTTDQSRSTSATRQPSEFLYIEANRLATFKNWPNPNISPESLAKAGFYYLNRSDEAKCAWCQGVIAKWEKHDNAFSEHQRFFPHCPRVQLGPLIEMASDGIRDLGIQQIIPPKEPKFSSLDARIRTYEKWPIPNIQDPMALAQAGLYYQNIKDQVRCFHCNIGLRSWQKDDDPWFEHTKWFPECQFVRLVKGLKYVESVLKATAEKRSSDQGHSNLSNATTPQPLSINEAMSTEPVRQALEMGIDGGAIRNLTRKQLTRTGHPFLTVDELIQAVFDTRHEQEEENSFEDDDGGRGERNLALDDMIPTASEMGELVEEDLPPQPSTSSSPNNHFVNMYPDQQRISSEPLVSIEDQNCTAEQTGSHAADQTQSSHEKSIELSLEEENRKLKDARMCKICFDEEVGVVFLPCGHLTTCVQCAPGVTECPMCRTAIKGYVRTFLS